ncbi:hypothetical protein QF037_009555 [Streptomyces canus]|uniref:condensation domain-containing protein n=1 Tax=Streptomyces canus TaxID=58343 RepID=UPI00278493BA|nr:condensation domain-containing protein [Streptomyces canus]MDQ0605210.1 hypothetical protein [Streptomyces canus]
MRITDLHRCGVRPGRLVEWTLSPATLAVAAGLAQDSRPPAYIQEGHIRTAKAVRERGVIQPTWIGLAFDLPGPVDLEALQDALQTWTVRHETLRSGFRWDGDTLCRFTLDGGDVSLRREVAGDFPDAGELVRHLRDRFDAATDALSWPNYLYTAVVRDDSTSVYMAFDHINVDAYSLQNLPAEIDELYTTAVDGCEVRHGPAASYIDFCEIERADADRADVDHDMVARWRDFIRRCDGRLPSFQIDVGHEPDGRMPQQTIICEMLTSPEDAAAFEAYCRPYGGSLVGLLAASALLIHKLAKQPVFRTIVPFHTRVRSQWSGSVGWYVGNAPVEIAVDRAHDFTGALRAARDNLRVNKRLARMPLDRVLTLIGPEFRPTSPDLYSGFSYIDARLFPGAERWAEMRASCLLRVSRGDQTGVWVSRLHEGLHITTRHPDNDIADKNMRLYVERLRGLITSVPTSGSLDKY